MKSGHDTYEGSLEIDGSIVVSTDLLGKSYHAEMHYENPDGSALIFDTDFLGSVRSTVKPGTFEVAEGKTFVVGGNING